MEHRSIFRGIEWSLLIRWPAIDFVDFVISQGGESTAYSPMARKNVELIAFRKIEKTLLITRLFLFADKRDCGFKISTLNGPTSSHVTKAPCRWNFHPPSIISLLYTLININHCTLYLSNDRLPEIRSETRIRSNNFIWYHMRRILFFIWEYQNFDMSKFSVNTRVSSKFSRYFFFFKTKPQIQKLYSTFSIYSFLWQIIMPPEHPVHWR